MHQPVAPARSRLGALLAFLNSEAAGGVALILSALVALALANSPAGETYRMGTRPTRSAPGRCVCPAAEWVNDGLMALFFLLVGVELRRSMTVGKLASPRLAALPGIAALGGMVVPALIYAAFNWGDPAALRGWAVPVATDIAFALAVMSVLGRRVPERPQGVPGGTCHHGRPRRDRGHRLLLYAQPRRSRARRARPSSGRRCSVSTALACGVSGLTCWAALRCGCCCCARAFTRRSRVSRSPS